MRQELLTVLRCLVACAMLSTCGAGLAADACTVNGKAWPVCGSDRGGWAFENGNYCIARSFCPANRTGLPGVKGRAAPVDAGANAKTRRVYGYLRSISGKQVIAGQQDLTWNDATDMAERVYDDTGKYPALMGYDFMNYGGGTGDGLHQTEEAIAWWKRGGLVTFVWHWRARGLDAAAGVKPAFYTRQTSFTIPVKDGALDTSSEAYARIDDSIDVVAAELRKLSDAGVPVLWRPLHEASGNNGEGWFWWGRARNDGVPQAYANILLWRHLYDRLVRVHGLHNLIWVWNGQDPAWYPGDDTVDVIGWDIYDKSDNKTYGSQLGTYRRAQMMSAEQKLIALSENSFIPDPDKMAQDGAMWSWFMTWNDGIVGAAGTDPKNFWAGEYYNTSEHKRRVYNHPSVITLDKLPPF